MHFHSQLWVHSSFFSNWCGTKNLRFHRSNGILCLLICCFSTLKTLSRATSVNAAMPFWLHANTTWRAMKLDPKSQRRTRIPKGVKMGKDPAVAPRQSRNKISLHCAPIAIAMHPSKPTWGFCLRSSWWSSMWRVPTLQDSVRRNWRTSWQLLELNGPGSRILLTFEVSIMDWET